jgi:hypothetical protein
MVNSTDELAALRAVVEDNSKPQNERSAAAGLIVTLTVDAVADPTDEDAEVVKLRTPSDDGGPLSDVMAAVTQGRSRTGWSLADARAEVFERHRLRAVLAVVVDEAAPNMIRLAACQTVLDQFMHPNGRYRQGAYSPERLLAEVVPADAFKHTSQSMFKGKVPVCRPPKTFADVW